MAGDGTAAVPGGDGAPTTRNRILHAAEEQFARGGFNRTPVSRIAQAAGVPHGLVFYYFPTKVELLLEVVRGYTSTFVVALDGSLRRNPDPTGSPRELVDTALDGLRRQLDSHTDVRRIVFQEMAAHPEVRRQAQLLHQHTTEAVRALFEAGMGRIGLPVDQRRATAAARMLIGTALIGAVFYEGEDDPMLPVDDLAAAVTRALHG